MINKISRHLARILVSTDETRMYDEDAYYYGFSVLISTLTSILAVLVIAIISGLFFESIAFMAAFILTRFKGGGYHASTHARCIMLFALTFIAAAVLHFLLPQQFYLLFFIVCSCLCSAIIWMFAPLPAKNKPVSDEKKKRLRGQCLIIAGCFLTVAVLSAFIHAMQCQILLLMYTGYFAASVSMLVAKMQKGE